MSIPHYYSAVISTNLSFSISVAETHKSDGESSLAASTVIMPYNGHARSTVGNNQHVGSSVKPSTDATSVGGSSIGSSVSLISVPASETEDDVAWEDSRSQAIQSPSAQGARAMNYVVLYDDESSSDDSA